VISQRLNADETGASPIAVSNSSQTDVREAFAALCLLLDGLLSGSSDMQPVSKELTASVAAFAREHRLLPLIYRLSEQSRSQRLPAPLFAEAWARHEANAVANRKSIAELTRISMQFRNRGIRFVCHKGAALARSLYADDAARVYSDIDVLLARKDVFRAVDALSELGYRGGERIAAQRRHAFLDAKRQYDLELFNAETHTALELHWRTDAQHPIGDPDDDGWWASLDSVDLGDLPVLQLNRRELMFALLIHGTKHQWERLSWLVDIVVLAQRFDAPDWTWLAEEGRKRRCEVRLFFGLRLASWLFPRAVPPTAQTTPGVEKKLAAVVDDTHAKLCAGGEVATSIWSSIGRDLRCNDTPWQSFRQAMLLAFTPNHHDWQHVGAHPLARLTSFASRVRRKLSKRV
jgi:hypothetical protein